MAKLTEQQAWKIVKIVYSHNPGMCFSICYMIGLGLITNNTAYRMRKRIKKRSISLNGRQFGYLFPMSEAAGGYNQERLNFAEEQIKRISGKRARKRPARG